MHPYGHSRRTFAAALFAAMLGIAGAPARADYAATSGMIEIIPPPPLLTIGALQSNTAIRTFAENRGIALAAALGVDSTATGTVDSLGSLGGGAIAAGTRVDSYLFHSDTASGDVVYAATASFTTAILGVIVLTSTLNATDPAVGHVGTTYPASTLRGLEFDPPQDSIAISADRRTVTLNFSTHSSVDEIRVITAATVPEPASVALLGLGGLAIAGVAARRRAATAG